MPSSTSSSDRRLPRLRWHWILGGASLLLLACAGGMEATLAVRGFKPSVLDSSRDWGRQRARATALGSETLALVGASHILLDVDVATLRSSSGLEPVQLAIDGGSFMPVLAGLANDPAFHGTVLVDFDAQTLSKPSPRDPAYGYQRDYQRSLQKLLPDFGTSEDYLTEGLHAHLRSYADGTKPVTALLHRVFSKPSTDQYLRQLPDREILADYRLVPMPYFYYFRSFRNLTGAADPPAGLSNAELDERLEQGIAAVQPADDRLFLAVLPVVYAMADNIKARGGRVIFVNFPVSGYVKQIDARRYPRRQFWDRFAAGAPFQTLDYEDVPSLAGFECPDGSHLDYRDRDRFTTALSAALHLGPAPRPDPR